MDDVDARLDEIGRQIAVIASPCVEPEDRLGEAIGKSLDFGEVLHRTLAAAEAVRDAHGSSISLRHSDGSLDAAVRGVVEASFASSVGALESPDGTPFVAQLTSWDSTDSEAVRACLTVPLGKGSLSVYSRVPGAFDSEAASLLAAIAQQAAPAVHAALSSIDAQRPAAVVCGGGASSTRRVVARNGRRLGDEHAGVERGTPGKVLGQNV